MKIDSNALASLTAPNALPLKQARQSFSAILRQYATLDTSATAALPFGALGLFGRAHAIAAPQLPNIHCANQKAAMEPPSDETKTLNSALLEETTSSPALAVWKDNAAANNAKLPSIEGDELASINTGPDGVATSLSNAWHQQVSETGTVKQTPLDRRSLVNQLPVPVRPRALSVQVTLMQNAMNAAVTVRTTKLTPLQETVLRQRIYDLTAEHGLTLDAVKINGTQSDFTQAIERRTHHGNR